MRQSLYTTIGRQYLVSAKVTVDAALTADSTNYWTFQLRTFRPDDTFGTAIRTFSTSTFDLTVEGVIVFRPATPLLLENGSQLVVDITATGSPAALAEPVVWLEIRS
jgi:hypothetical protein